MRKTLVLPTLILLAATTVSLWLTKDHTASQAPAPGTETGTGQAAIGGTFTLTDHNGKSFSDASVRGKVMMVFFGFTHCPDICPVSVANLSKMMESLGDKADQVVPIFITVDPKRDTPDVMKDYLKPFDPRIVGLSGTADEIASVVSQYKAYYAVKEPEAGHEGGEHAEHGGAAGGNDYMVDHSGFIYLMGKDGVYVKHFPYDASPREMADAVSGLL